MKEEKDGPKEVSTCFEDSPCAELMEKILGEDGTGIGSLCEEMMRTVAERSARGQDKDQESGGVK